MSRNSPRFGTAVPAQLPKQPADQICLRDEGCMIPCRSGPRGSYIDDAVLVFRNVSQLSRLLPEGLQHLQLFADMGLAVNVSKSCLFGLHLPCALPPCLAGCSVRSWSTYCYLGQTTKLVEGDEHLVSLLCRRATSAFFANRPLLAHSPACSSLSSPGFVHFLGLCLHSLVLVCCFCQAIQPHLVIPSCGYILCHSPYWDVIKRSCSPLLVCCGMPSSASACC